ncbi:hypothetical protein QQZ08_008794 [Neonectria magnoliae]|uniref:Uncharacterized protein n=1 Tax=Neonectria magnoliae TaxID=2732573 RepID=A0ABR1HS06_9HYPO
MLREQVLRIARLQRAGHRKEEIFEVQKKKLAQLDYISRYNSAARKWVSSIIALPILLVTSYYLFDRPRSWTVVLGNVAKVLPKDMQQDNE